MASKARFFNVTLVNGYGSHQYIFPSQNKTDLRIKLSTSETRVADVDYIGWFSVNVVPDESGTYPEFIAEIDGKTIAVRPDNPGYPYLRQQFGADYQDVEDYIKNPPEY